MIRIIFTTDCRITDGDSVTVDQKPQGENANDRINLDHPATNLERAGVPITQRLNAIHFSAP